MESDHIEAKCLWHWVNGPWNSLSTKSIQSSKRIAQPFPQALVTAQNHKINFLMLCEATGSSVLVIR